MRIDIKGTQLDLTDALKAYVNLRLGPLGRLLQKYENAGELTMFVELKRDTGHKKGDSTFYAEALVELPGKKVVRANRSGADLRAALDEVKDVMKLELAKYKELNTDAKVRMNRKEV